MREPRAGLLVGLIVFASGGLYTYLPVETTSGRTNFIRINRFTGATSYCYVFNRELSCF
jgi:hypothetical protein